MYAARTELTADFRAKFGISLDSVGYEVSYSEAYRLVIALCKDPSTWISAAIGEWDYPVTREWIKLNEVGKVLASLQTDAKGQKKIAKLFSEPWTKTEKLSTAAAVPLSKVEHLYKQMRDGTLVLKDETVKDGVARGKP